ncbi:hypothetical protein CVT24_001730 [Panaeolus cyanescens]|uniref:Uncharacterized protein n=1 Tax=Panaeolus cyanescens TaxID=181874 RepID=A0A409YFR1_9AGAR|nr:hypothetical protein CVT24_001730 [Panaeolus cyanescens]
MTNPSAGGEKVALIDEIRGRNVTSMLVNPNNARIRSRPTRIYLKRNSPKLNPSPYHPEERKRIRRRSPLFHFKFSITAIFLIIVFHCSYCPRTSSSHQDDVEPPERYDSSSPTHPLSSDNVLTNITSSPSIHETQKGTKTPKERDFNWKRPLVDRTMLDKADGSFHKQVGVQQTELATDSIREPTWRPTVWEIPKKNTYRPASEMQVVAAEINDPKQPQAQHPSPIVNSPPEKFLLILRIAEQESRARQHLSQLIQLATELNRTLVLPNVGKSRIGACYHWDFETYYDPDSLARHDVITPIDFKKWITQQPSATSRTVSIRSQSQDAPPEDHASYEDLYFKAYQGPQDFNDTPRLASCLRKRFPLLQLTHHISRILVNEDTDARKEPDRAESFTAVLRSVTNFYANPSPLRLADPESTLGAVAVAEPAVLIVDWDLRHPIFDSSLVLKYSKRLERLAERIGPRGSYIAVHWRTETVSPNILGECAAALVETLQATLRDEEKSKNITAVWLASDYPRAVNEKKNGVQQVQLNKSGTYKRLTPQLEAAINVLREAFSASGSLGEWMITDLLDIDEKNLHDDAWLLTDIGSRGILDKIISIKAKIFISGSRGCSRYSSYTGQIIDARADMFDLEQDIVEIFGYGR